MAVGSPRGNPPVVVVHNMGPGSSFERQIRDVAMVKIRQGLAGIDQELVQEVEGLVAQRLTTDRGEFRHKKGTVHLAGSFYSVVDMQSDPMVIGVRSHANQKKVAALEFGNPSHVIKTDKKALFFPGTNSRSPVRLESRSSPSRAALSSARASKGKLVNAGKEVTTRDVSAFHFMRDAVNNVIQRRLGNKVFK